MADEAGISLVAYHYNIGSPLDKVDAGQYNFDITSPTGKRRIIIELTIYLFVYLNNRENSCTFREEKRERERGKGISVSEVTSSLLPFCSSRTSKTTIPNYHMSYNKTK